MPVFFVVKVCFRISLSLFSFTTCVLQSFTFFFFPCILFFCIRLLFFASTTPDTRQSFHTFPYFHTTPVSPNIIPIEPVYSSSRAARFQPICHFGLVSRHLRSQSLWSTSSSSKNYGQPLCHRQFARHSHCDLISPSPLHVHFTLYLFRVTIVFRFS